MRSHAWPAWGDGLLVAGATALAFLPGVFGEFVSWDDDGNFVHNPAYRGLGWPQLRWMLTTTHMGPYAPLTWLSLGLDYTIWGMRPLGYHLTSLALHAGAAVLMALVARRLIGLALREPPDGPTCRAGAVAAALVFAVHPLRVESVVWITERRDVLSGLLYLGALLAYLRAVPAGTGAGHARRRPYWTSVGLFAAALLAKSMVVTLPAALLVLDVYPLRRAWAWRLVTEKAPYLALALAASAAAFVGIGSVHNAPTLEEMGVPLRLLVSVYGLAFYLWKSLWPLRLWHIYEPPLPIEPLAPPFAASAVTVLLLVVLAWLLRRRMPGLAAAAACYVITVLPVLGVFQNGPQVAADRYTYLPCLGWAVLAGGGVAWAFRRWSRAPGLTPAALALTAAAMAVVALVGLSARQSLVWRDSWRLWEHALALDPGNRRAHTGYGALLLVSGRPDRARPHFQEAVRRDPDLAEAVMGLALSMSATGEAAQAVPLARRAVDLRPFEVGMRHHLGEVLALAGDREGALAAFETAARMGWPYAPHAAAVLLAELGRRDEALQALAEGDRRRRALDPGDPEIDRQAALVHAPAAPAASAAAWHRYLDKIQRLPKPTLAHLAGAIEARRSLDALEARMGPRRGSP